ncbi:MAG: chromate transporter [Stellaceae bacterium]
MREPLGDGLATLALVFVPLSFMAFGGSNAVLPDIAHQTVAVHGWMSGREFADFFALSRAAPGPGSMLTALIGWKVAGLAGALVATIGLYVPSAVLVYVVARLWGRWRGRAWHDAVERGVAPIAAGLLLSAGIAVLRASPGGLPIWLAAIAATAILLRWPRLPPIALIAAGGALFGIAGAIYG